LFGLRWRQAAPEGASDQRVTADATELDMEQQSLNRTAVFDRAGMSASLACAVHCALLPVALAALPALGLAWLDSPWVDWSMVILALGIALRAHRGGYRLHHRCLPSGVALGGVAIIVAAICLLEGSASHHYVQASGAVMIAGSHLLNHQFCKTCATCRNESECGRDTTGGVATDK
jgi:MerC mercury resistance protein